MKRKSVGNATANGKAGDDQAAIAQQRRKRVPRACDGWGSPALFDLLQRLVGKGRDRIKKLLGDLVPSGGRVLDVACGTGEMSSAFTHARYFGVDRQYEYVTYARRHRRAQCAVMDATRLAVADGSFATVVAVNALHHFDDASVRRFVGEAARVLSPDGHLAIVDFTPDRNRDLVQKAVIALDRGRYVRTADACMRLLDDRFELCAFSRVPNWPWNYAVFVLAPRGVL